jgi:hypothetical protein
MLNWDLATADKIYQIIGALTQAGVTLDQAYDAIGVILEEERAAQYQLEHFVSEKLKLAKKK